jgi:DNA-binding NtrC family response regulator
MRVPGYPTQPVLIIDDESEATEECRFMLRASGVDNVVCCHDSRDVLPMLSEREFSIILLDLWMPHISGNELLTTIAETYPQIPVIIVTGANDVETAVECMRQGAHDYMVKPVERNRMLSGIRRAIEIREVENEYKSFQKRVFSAKLERPEVFAQIVTHDQSMLVLFQYVETIARTRKPVLITGETGVGKELIARSVHSLSGCQGGFVAVNVAAVDDSTFSDTLFGHQKGSFTDAQSARDGLIKQAAEGTLFLDEIGDLSAANQAKLLRLIQEGEYFPLGMDIPKKTTARIVAATNQDLDAKVRQGHFRTDLLHRLRAHHVHVPPLRNRPDDIPVLVEFLLEKFARELNKSKPSVPPELFTLLAAYDFPGNVRELENLVFEAVSVHGTGKLSLDKFRARIHTAPSDPQRQVNVVETDEMLFRNCRVLPAMRTVRQSLIHEALRRAKGNQSIAADLIGVSQSGISRLMNER